MKIYRNIYTILLAALQIGWGCLFIGCTDSDTDVSGSMSVQLFLDDGKTTPIPSDAVTFPGSVSSLKVKPGADYQVFGFLPSNANALSNGTNGASSVTVNSQTKTATLTIDNLAPLSTADVCVVIGVKGKLAPNEKVVAGSFKYHAPENTEEGFGVSLLVDHLFAAMAFSYKVDATYDAIRTIKLKKVVMKSTSAKKVKAEITLQMNDGGTNPITNVVFTPSEAAQKEIVLYQSEDEAGTALQVLTPLEFMGFYGADLGSTLSIESTYDIYDKDDKDGKDGNLIEKDRKAVNNLATVLSEITRGKKVNVNIKVIPTYLYVLSDTDAEFVIEVK